MDVGPQGRASPPPHLPPFHFPLPWPLSSRHSLCRSSYALARSTPGAMAAEETLRRRHGHRALEQQRSSAPPPRAPASSDPQPAAAATPSRCFPNRRSPVPSMDLTTAAGVQVNGLPAASHVHVADGNSSREPVMASLRCSGSSSASSSPLGSVLPQPPGAPTSAGSHRPLALRRIRVQALVPVFPASSAPLAASSSIPERDDQRCPLVDLVER
ncbi:uncharacterized protein LOC119308470 [Triticum dicoccoides]|uniref:uncharacterized protein LOC119308470 n=1 Tax=Triticum dicoccoides TaxID=85692 RepID=UPI00188DFD2D|nr:uncharacterized protein LOC119308470 [Triticum dicoccoides]